MKNTIKTIEENKIIVIVRGVEREKLVSLCEAMYNGGIKAVECTYDATGKISDEEISENIRLLVDNFGDKMIIGTGTVLTKKQVALTKAAGGKFIISPDTNPKIIKYTKRQGLVSIPGALTPSEIALSARTGADFVKVFPVNLFGPDYIKTIKAPLSAGAVGVGIGGGIVDKKLIAENDFEGITIAAQKYCEEAKKC